MLYTEFSHHNILNLLDNASLEDFFYRVLRSTLWSACKWKQTQQKWPTSSSVTLLGSKIETADSAVAASRLSSSLSLSSLTSPPSREDFARDSTPLCVDFSSSSNTRSAFCFVLFFEEKVCVCVCVCVCLKERERWRGRRGADCEIYSRS